MPRIVFDKEESKKIRQSVGQVLLVLVTMVLLVFCLLKWGEQMRIVLVNFMVALVGVFLAIEAMLYGYRRLDRSTNYDTSTQLEQGNQAVGLAVGGLFVGIGIVVGFVIALGVN